MLRIGIDASNLRAGGGVTHLIELLTAADPVAQGVERIIVWGGQATLCQLPDRPWLTLVHVPALDQRLPRRFFWQTFLLASLARGSCDILFAPGGTYLGGLRPFVTMSRNLLPFERAETRRYGISLMRLKLLMLRWIQKITFARADGLIFISDYARRTVIADLPNSTGSVVTIPHGVDSSFQHPPKAQRAIGSYSYDRPFRLLYVSTIALYKHQWNVVEAVTSLRRTGLPIDLELIGSGEGEPLRRLLAAVRAVDAAEDFIHVRGSVPYRDLPARYHAADAFVFASSCENLSNILIEAMAAGLPIACARRGPMPEVLRSAGVYFDPEQPADIAQALQTLITDPVLRQCMAQVAHEQSQAYRWQRCAHDTLRFLVRIAELAAA